MQTKPINSNEFLIEITLGASVPVLGLLTVEEGIVFSAGHAVKGAQSISLLNVDAEKLYQSELVNQFGEDVGESFSFIEEIILYGINDGQSLESSDTLFNEPYYSYKLLDKSAYLNYCNS